MKCYLQWIGRVAWITLVNEIWVGIRIGIVQVLGVEGHRP